MWNLQAASLSVFASRSVLMASHVRPASSTSVKMSGASTATQSYDKLKSLLREVSTNQRMTTPTAGLLE